MVISLARNNFSARPIAYQKQQYKHTSFAARWVLATGVLLLIFIVMHVSQFAFGILTPFEFVQGDIYHNLSLAFQSTALVIFYLLALLTLGLHLHHGIWSLTQTLGLDNPDRNFALRLASALITGLLVMIFASIPLAFYFGLLPIRL